MTTWKRTPPLERFNKKWKPDPNGCHIWTGFQDKRGYGQFWDDKNHKAHRWALSMATGEWPHPKVLAMHTTCDNPPCVNPEHLSWGTHADNTADMMAKGRNSTTGGAPRKLTDQEVTEIRAAYIPRKNSMAMLGSQYGVSKGRIHQLIHGARP